MVINIYRILDGCEEIWILCSSGKNNISRVSAARDAGTTGAAGASAPLAFCIFNFVGAVRVQTRGATGAQNFYNRRN